MWNVIRELGDSERLIQCSECGYQTIATEFPSECPNCGEPAEEMTEPRAIDTRKSAINLKDIEEPEVVVYERDTPAYKLWYFWLILVMCIILALGGLYFARNLMTNTAPEQPSSDVTNMSGLEFSFPSGWGADGESYVSPDETASVSVYTKEVSRFLKTDDVADLVKDLSGSDTISDKTVRGINGKLLTKKIEVAEDKEILYSRYIFVDNSRLYMITYRSDEQDEATFDKLLDTMGVM